MSRALPVFIVVLASLLAGCGLPGAAIHRRPQVLRFMPDRAPELTPTGPTPETVEVVGRNKESVSRCLGVLIAPRVALTAAHCIHDTASLTVDLALTPRGAVEVVRSWTDTNRSETGHVDLDDSDVAVLELARAIVLPTYPSFARQPLTRGTKAMGVTRIPNGLQGMQFTLRRSPRAPAHYASGPYSKKGDSGGPVYVGATDRRVVVAVVSGGSDERTLLARVDQVSESIDAVVAKTSAPRRSSVTAP